MEHHLWWNTIFDGRQPLMEDDLLWKTTFHGILPLMEDAIWWKATSDRARSLMDDKLWLKMTFYGRLLFMEYFLWWKTTFDGRRLLMQDDLWWKKTFERRFCIDYTCAQQWLKTLRSRTLALWVRQDPGKSLCAWLYPRAQCGAQHIDFGPYFCARGLATRTCAWLCHAHVYSIQRRPPGRHINWHICIRKG